MKYLQRKWGHSSRSLSFGFGSSRVFWYFFSHVLRKVSKSSSLTVFPLNLATFRSRRMAPSMSLRVISHSALSCTTPYQKPIMSMGSVVQVRKRRQFPNQTANNGENIWLKENAKPMVVLMPMLRSRGDKYSTTAKNVNRVLNSCKPIRVDLHKMANKYILAPVPKPLTKRAKL